MYFLKEDKKSLIDWDTFKEYPDYFISDTDTNNIATGRYIKIYKATNEVEFVNAKSAFKEWSRYDMLESLLVSI
jgi:hypothetical protein